MTPKLEKWSIVIVGGWSTSIFNPEWIGSNLSSSPTIEVGFDINDPLATLEYRFDDLRLRVTTRRLQIHPVSDKPETLKRWSAVATKVLSLLPHVPIRGAGLNFCFLESEPSKKLLGAFSCSDTANIADAGWVVENTTITRRLSTEGRVCNLVISRETAGVEMTFNFHHAVKNANEASIAFSASVEKTLQECYDFATKVYVESQ